MKLRAKKIRVALGGLQKAQGWNALKRRLRPLTDAELKEADSLERLGARRQNMLRQIHAEKQRRAGKPKKMLRLRMEVSE